MRRGEIKGRGEGGKRWEGEEMGVGVGRKAMGELGDQEAKGPRGKG